VTDGWTPGDDRGHVADTDGLERRVGLPDPRSEFVERRRWRAMTAACVDVRLREEARRSREA
jgi:hypothetical protein